MVASTQGVVYGFEEIDATLPFIPLAARRVLDGVGLKLALEGWLSLSPEDRRALAAAGGLERVPATAASIVNRAVPAAAATDPVPDPDARSAPREVVEALGPERPLDDSRWRALRAIDRYALCKCRPKPSKLSRAYDEIVATPRRLARLTHLTREGAATMVDVGSKPVTFRRAVASASVRTTPEVLRALADSALPKGDVIAAARIAGILAAKRTPELIPLCHPVQTTHAAIDFVSNAPTAELRVRATVEATDRTGVEMEAMMAASVAALTVYDMIKSEDRWASIDSVRLEEKSGGKSGLLIRPGEPAAR